MTRAALCELVARWMAAGWQDGNVEALAPLHADDFVDHSSAGRCPDLAGLLAGVTELYAAFPDFYAVVDRVLVDESMDTVAVCWSATGTHRGKFLGVAPNGRSISFTGIEILTVRRGLIAERWGEWNGLDIQTQLCASAPPPGTAKGRG